MKNMITERPYPGLRPFTYEESDIFFGREDHTDQLLEKLGDTRFISVVGLSGCGKSSLVRAGMIAALRSGYLAETGTHWNIIEMHPGESPFLNLARALLANPVLMRACAHIFDQKNLLENNDIAILLDLLQSSPFSLAEIFHKAELPPENNLLLCVDQFEEIFRFYKDDTLTTREVFIKLLLMSAQQQEVPIYIVITMRSDFLGHCAQFYELPEIINKGQFLVPRLTPDQQRMAIEGPAGVFSGTIEPDLIDCLLAEMGNDPDQLPLLQHCLMRMWLHAQERRNLKREVEITLTFKDYEAVGGLKDALSNHVEETFQALNIKQQKIAETLFRCLCERLPGQRDVRHPASLGEVADVADVLLSEVMEVTEIFRHSEQCFITPSPRISLEPDTVLDLSHESLIRKWNRLKNWVEQEAESAALYQHLEHTAHLWQHGKAALWSNPDLDNALIWREKEKPTNRWALRYGSNFDLAMNFLNASIKAQEERILEEDRKRKEEERKKQKELDLEKQVTELEKLAFSRSQEIEETLDKNFATKTQRLAIITKIIALINSNQDIITTLVNIIEQLRHIFIFDYVTIALLPQETKDKITLLELYPHPASSLSDGVKVPFDDPVLNYVVFYKRALFHNRARWYRCFIEDRVIVEKQMGTVFCAPILSSDTTWGAMNLGSIEAHDYSKEVRDILAFVAIQIGVAFERDNIRKTIEEMNQEVKQKTYELRKSIITMGDANLRLFDMQQQLREKDKKIEALFQEVQEKNDELNSTLETLKQTQTVLIQSEKMGSLGQLSAGITYELNTIAKDIEATLKTIPGNAQGILVPYAKLVNSNIPSSHLNIIIKLVEAILESIKRQEEKSPSLIREQSKLIEQQLNEQGITNSYLIAENIVQCGIEQKFEHILALFQVYDPGFLMDVLMHYQQVFTSSIKSQANIEIILKIARAIKAYSYVDSTEEHLIDLNEDILTLTFCVEIR